MSIDGFEFQKYILSDSEICHMRLIYFRMLSVKKKNQKEECQENLIFFFLHSSFSIDRTEKEQYLEQYQREFDIVPNIVLNIVLLALKSQKFRRKCKNS